ncbi:unnamed protein product [Hymenolepis diminuta]|uniref:Uncharacterized protein n=1 Tax=Hymenolepis diminuta TaxID=6216 RepID=A0A564YR26_HYMDI|nr:unnamed protein product [Hymenolepis diminuta]
METPVRESALDKIYRKFLEFNEASNGKPILWNVGYNRLGNEQEFVSFSTSLNGLIVRVEIHKPQTAYKSESLRVLCEPMISLIREDFLLEELMKPQNFISDVIHPAILEEMRDTKISFCGDEKV